MKKKTALRVHCHQWAEGHLCDGHAYLSYQAACLWQFSVTSSGRLAAVSVIRSALEQKQSKIPPAIETLLEVRNSGDANGVWEPTESEHPAVLEGMEMAEKCIGTLDVALLALTAARLLDNVSAEQTGQQMPGAWGATKSVGQGSGSRAEKRSAFRRMEAWL